MYAIQCFNINTVHNHTPNTPLFSVIETNLDLSINLVHMHDYDTSTCLAIPASDLVYWWMDFNLVVSITEQYIDVWASIEVRTFAVSKMGHDFDVLDAGNYYA